MGHESGIREERQKYDGIRRVTRREVCVVVGQKSLNEFVMFPPSFVD